MIEENENIESVSTSQIENLLSGLAADRFFLVEEKKVQTISDEEKIRDWYKIKEIFDNLDILNATLYQGERLKFFIDEVKKRI